MRIATFLSTTALAVMLGGCATYAQSDAPAPLARGALQSREAAVVGQVELLGTPGALRVHVTVTGLPAGTYGTHVHAVGQCVAPAFTSAGPHWNPTSRQHGRLNPMGSHHGDLPNLVVGADGRGEFTAPLPGTFAELRDGDGAALVVHARPDDELTDPTGNSGDRIACAVFTPVAG